MKIYVKKVDGATLPKLAIVTDKNKNSIKSNAAGYDIIATSEPQMVGDIDPVNWKNIQYIQYETNLFIAPEFKNYHVLIHPRSSISKYNLVLANSIGLIDNDYRGMVMCRFKYIWQPEDLSVHIQKIESMNAKLFGIPNMDKIYKKGDAIAQLVVEPTTQVDWTWVDELDETARGDGGFGSTDIKKTKSLVELFEEDTRKLDIGKGTKPISIADKYASTGGIHTQTPYSEQMKQRTQ
jgi:dUTPase